MLPALHRRVVHLFPAGDITSGGGGDGGSSGLKPVTLRTAPQDARFPTTNQAGLGDWDWGPRFQSLALRFRPCIHCTAMACSGGVLLPRHYQLPGLRKAVDCTAGQSAGGLQVGGLVGVCLNSSAILHKRANRPCSKQLVLREAALSSFHVSWVGASRPSRPWEMRFSTAIWSACRWGALGAALKQCDCLSDLFLSAALRVCWHQLGARQSQLLGMKWGGRSGCTLLRTSTRWPLEEHQAAAQSTAAWSSSHRPPSLCARMAAA